MANRRVIPQKVKNEEIELPRLLEELGSPQKVADHIGVARGTVVNWFVARGWRPVKVRHTVWVQMDEAQR
jgi:hypothetical protein